MLLPNLVHRHNLTRCLAPWEHLQACFYLPNPSTRSFFNPSAVRQGPCRAVVCKLNLRERRSGCWGRCCPSIPVERLAQGGRILPGASAAACSGGVPIVPRTPPTIGLIYRLVHPAKRMAPFTTAPICRTIDLALTHFKASSRMPPHCVRAAVGRRLWRRYEWTAPRMKAADPRRAVSPGFPRARCAWCQMMRPLSSCGFGGVVLEMVASSFSSRRA